MLRKDSGDREMVEVLSLVLQHNEEDVLRAVELAVEAGVPTKTHILNLLHRLIDRKLTDHPEIDPPDALALQITPGFGPKARHALWLKKAGGTPLPPALTFRGRMPRSAFGTGEQAKSAGPNCAVGRGYHDLEIRRNYLSKLNLFSRTNQSLKFSSSETVILHTLSVTYKFHCFTQKKSNSC